MPSQLDTILLSDPMTGVSRSSPLTGSPHERLGGSTAHWSGGFPDPAAARAGAGRRGKPQPALCDRQGLAAARLHPVEPGPGLRVPRRRGLGAGGLPAGPGRQDRDDRQPADRGQPAVLPPGDRHPVQPGRRLGPVGRPLDRRGGPARHRAARLPGGHPRRRPGQAGSAPDGAHDGRLRLRREDRAAGRRLRLVPGAGHPGLAPQHRRGHRLPGRRAAARPDRAGREPAHDLLPQPGAGRARPGAGRDDVRDPRRGRRLHHAGCRDDGLPAQLGDDRQGRHLRPAAAPRRRHHAGAEVLEGLRPHRLRARRRAGPGRAGRPSWPSWTRRRPGSSSSGRSCGIDRPPARRAEKASVPDRPPNLLATRGRP